MKIILAMALRCAIGALLSLVPATGNFSLIQPVLALDRKDVFNRLTQIPVFTLVNEKGNPILVSPKNDKSGTQYATFFLSPQEIQNFNNALKASNPTLAKAVSIRALPLGKALEFGEAQKAQNKPLKIDIIPHKSTLDFALTLAKKTNKDLKTFPGIPIFALTDLTGKKVISVQRKDSTTPNQLYFFDETDAQNALNNLTKSNNKLAAQTRISVAPFQNLLGILLKMEKSSDADRIVMIPSQTSLKFAKQVNPAPASSK